MVQLLLLGKGIDPNIKKVIASTAKLLINKQHDDTVPYLKMMEVYLPQPSQGFIDKYISEYNSGNPITEVYVEYRINIATVDQDIQQLIPKLDPFHNTITIHPIKRVWNKQEVVNRMEKAYEQGEQSGLSDYNNCKFMTLEEVIENYLYNND